MTEQLLNSKQMAQFVTDGYLRFDAVVPNELNKEAIPALESGLERVAAGTPLSQAYPGDSVIGRIIQLPKIAGAIRSLVGANCLVDHHAIHIRHPQEGESQHLHGDAIIDPRRDAFDIQLMYYPQAVTREMGGTVVVPGSHLRRINETDIGRYQNLLGQVALTCKPGTVMVLHHGIWHCGRRNASQQTRYMYKIRLNPTVRQTRLWDTSDLHDPAVTEHLRRQQPWYEYATGRLEIANRARIWRYLTGDSDYDTDYWLTRIENRPTRLVAN